MVFSSVCTVTLDGRKLIAATATGMKQFIHLPLTLLHREADGDAMTVVVRNAERGTSVLRVSTTDMASLAIIDGLPRATDRVEVQRVLNKGTHSGGPLELEEVSGWVATNGRVITVVA